MICGFTSMIAHAGGPPFQIYVMPQRLPQTVFVGTGAILFTLLNWIKVPPYIALGQFSAANLSTAAALFPVAIASTYAGVWLVRRISGQRFYTIVYGLLILVGGKLIYRRRGRASPRGPHKNRRRSVWSSACRNSELVWNGLRNNAVNAPPNGCFSAG